MKALILGTAGLQITVPIEHFPYDYKSVYFMDDKVESDIAGVGYSMIQIMNRLGDDTTFLTGIGNDFFGGYIRSMIEASGSKCIIEQKDKASLISVILYDDEGKKSIMREGRKDYLYRMNPDTYKDLGNDYDVAVFTLAGFSKDLLPVVNAKNIPIVCDMQTTSNLFNDYGKDFREHSEVIFFSNDHYDGDLKQLVLDLYDRYRYKIIGAGMGTEGCMICDHGTIKRYPAVPAEVVNTVGAGDTLFGSFIHFYYNGMSSDAAIRNALKYVTLPPDQIS